MAEQQRQRRLRHLRDGFNSNLIIACQNQKWHVDSAILINGSQYFEDILDQDFQKGEERRLDFSDFDPRAIDAILVYLYTAEYDDLHIIAKEEQNGETPPLSTNAANTALKPALFKWNGSATSSHCTVLMKASKDQITDYFITLINTYVALQVIEIDELKALVVQTFWDRERYFRYCDMPQVVDTILSQTINTDEAIRHKFLLRCADNATNLRNTAPSVVDVLQEHEASCWDVGLRLHLRAQAKVDIANTVGSSKSDQDTITELRNKLEKEVLAHKSTKLDLDKLKTASDRRQVTPEVKDLQQNQINHRFTTLKRQIQDQRDTLQDRDNTIATLRAKLDGGHTTTLSDQPNSGRNVPQTLREARGQAARRLKCINMLTEQNRARKAKMVQLEMDVEDLIREWRKSGDVGTCPGCGRSGKDSFVDQDLRNEQGKLLFVCSCKTRRVSKQTDTEADA